MTVPDPVSRHLKLRVVSDAQVMLRGPIFTGRCRLRANPRPPGVACDVQPREEPLATQENIMRALRRIAIPAALGLALVACQKQSEGELPATGTPVKAPATAPTTPTAAVPDDVKLPDPELPTEKTEEMALDKAEEMAERREENYRAAAAIKPVGDSKVEGVVNFVADKDADGVEVKIKLSGLTPGKHGFHIHVKGDCTAPDASSAGGHFNPTGEQHGAPDDEHHHVGDLGNIEADDEGKVDTTKTLHGARIDTEPTAEDDRSILGRAVIVHAGEDDLKSQPSGDAGARVGCGVITKLEY